MTRRKIGQILVDLGYLTEDQLWDVLNEQQQNRSDRLLGQLAVEMGLVSDAQVAQAVAEQMGMQAVNLNETTIPSQVLDMVPEAMATVYKVIPVSFRNDVLTVAMAEPQNIAALDDLRNMLNIEIKGAVSNERDVRAAIERFYADKQLSIEDIVAELEKDDQLKEVAASMSEHSIDLESIEELADAAPVRKLLNMVMLLAIKDKASDIHFEPFEDEFKMRYKVDGVIYEMVPPPRHLAMAIATRIKVMSNLDIAERRLPQDGRIQLNVGGSPVDLRVSVLPTMFGESVVLRVLDRTVVRLDLNKIGMQPDILAQWREIIAKPNGIALVTGPTGSGKTTTLYSTLNELNDVSVKIITTEDPVEYELDGIVQVQINEEIGVTFANCLRSILRQDPDKILVGEIRDLETAEIAVQASLTGHIVYSTLHTNDAPATVTRLRDMGIPTFLITATVQGVLAQRLVRKICEDCKSDFEPSPEMLMEINLKPPDVVGKSFYYGRGCERCNNTGYKGRTGIYELLIINEDIRDLIMSNASTDQLRGAARKAGMVTLREAGLQAIFGGTTTIDEIVRETVVEDDT